MTSKAYRMHSKCTTVSYDLFGNLWQLLKVFMCLRAWSLRKVLFDPFWSLRKEIKQLLHLYKDAWKSTNKKFGNMATPINRSINLLKIFKHKSRFTIQFINNKHILILFLNIKCTKLMPCTGIYILCKKPP